MNAIRHNLARLTLAAALSLTAVGPSVAHAVETGAEAEAAKPAYLHGIGIDQKLGAAVPLDLKFRDDAGHTVRLGDYFDGTRKPVLLTMVYYACPQICTLSVSDLMKGMNGLSTLSAGDDYEVVVVSFDPRETPEQADDKKQTYLASYRRPHAAAGMHFLTGSPASIKALADAIGFHYRWDDKYQQFVHPTGHVVMTPKGTVSRYFFGVDYDLKDFRLSLEEASNNKIGTVTDRILLYCFHYDESSGTYTPRVAMFLKLGGLLTIGAIGAFWLAMQKYDFGRPPTKRAPPT